MKKADMHAIAAATAAVLGTFAALPAAQAAIVVSAAGQGYTQNFDTLSRSASVSPIGWTNDSTLVGWSLFTTLGPGSGVGGVVSNLGSSGQFVGA